MIAVWIASYLLTVVLFQPSTVNDPADDLILESEFIPRPLTPADLEFIEYQKMQLTEPVSWKNTIMMLLILALTAFISWQLRMLLKEQKEIEMMFKRFSEGYEDVNEVARFYEETKQSFIEMEKKSKLTRSRFEKLEKTIKDAKDIEKIKEDIDFVMSSWFGQYSSFSLLDINIFEQNTDGSEESRFELAKIKESFDGEISRLEEYLKEDLLSLIDTTRDVQMLERYFGK